MTCNLCFACRGRVQSAPRLQRVANIVFTVLFTIEMLLKLVALGLQYVKDGWNLLDAAVVIEVGSDAYQIHLRPAGKVR